MRRPLASVAVALLVAPALAAAELPRLTVYMVRGKGAGSILDDPDYQRAFREGVFARHDLTIDLSSGKAAFLDSLFGSQIAYLSLHANPNKIVVGSGDEVDVDDLVLAYRDHGHQGPALVIVTGCSTTRDLTAAKNIPKALGVRADSKKRAYIGFRTFKVGVVGDRYFRVFLATWMRARAGGGYPTLEEARGDAKAFVERMLKLQGEQTGKIARFAPADAATADQFEIVGDAGLRITDVVSR